VPIITASEAISSESHPGFSTAPVSIINVSTGITL